MVLEGFVDSEISEWDYKDLCSSIRDKLDFCICVTKTITETTEFRKPDTESPRGYKNTFLFYVTFPENHGTRKANKKFVEDKMAHLLEVCLEDDLPVGLEGAFDSSGKKTFAIMKVP
jgi:hypothetical protein